MSELRLDAHLDAVSAMARYMELLKLATPDRAPPARGRAAGRDRRDQPGAGAGGEPRAARAVPRLEPRRAAARRRAREPAPRRELIAERSESSLEAFLPIRGDGLMLSATDIDVYRTCPLRYKFARVFAIPREQTLPQRFGILFHQVLERYHTQLANEEAIGGVTLARAGLEPADGAVRDRLAAARLRRLQRGAPAPRQGASPRSSATTSASRRSSPRRCGSSAASHSASARTCCADESTASTATPTARTS